MSASLAGRFLIDDTKAAYCIDVLCPTRVDFAGEAGCPTKRTDR